MYVQTRIQVEEEAEMTIDGVDFAQRPIYMDLFTLREKYDQP